MNRNKCSQCGLVNSPNDHSCRRCGASLNEETTIEPALAAASPEEKPVQKRRTALRLGWILGTTLVLLFAAYMSLLLTSEELPYDQRQIVKSATAILKQKGFSRQAFVLDHLVQFRRTDNWWNGYVGHQSAYAATNFPFEVVTLYPEFFDTAVDDTERAAILLHESYHLFGSGEEAALEGAWRNKTRVGWTVDKYGLTKVWINTRDLTSSHVPQLFSCGADGHSDCFQ
ncbi:MAG: zinc ribbon domain-containing protein [Acidobacteriota bacterium]|nr:zinc ribbon domain-containing protein [Acidobacteriota bacterium]